MRTALRVTASLRHCARHPFREVSDTRSVATQGVTAADPPQTVTDQLPTSREPQGRLGDRLDAMRQFPVIFVALCGERILLVLNR